MAPVSAGKTAGGPASKARLTIPAFTPLKTSSAAVSLKTAFTALEPSFTTVFPETSLLMLKTSFAAVSSKAAFTALESSFTTVFPETSLLMLKTSFAAVSSKAAFTALEPSFTSLFFETGLAAQGPIPAAAAEAISTTMKISAAVTGTEAGISPEISIFLDFTFILRLHKTSLHFRSRFIRIPSLKIFRIKYITFIGIIVFPALFALGGSPGYKLGSAQILALAGRIFQ